MSMSSIDKRVKKSILSRRHGCQCAYCKKPLTLASATLDHVVPRCAGGSNKLENLALACRPCNTRKGGKSPHTWINCAMQGIHA